jgi:hypothetical protein
MSTEHQHPPQNNVRVPQRSFRARWTLGIVVAAVCSVLLAYQYLYDWEGQPCCHKQVDLAFTNWQQVGGTKLFPNIDGQSSASLAEISQYMGGVWLEESYMYVPGLNWIDPGELVLMYYAKPTRWTWHGSPPTIFTEKAWILIPVDMTYYGGTRELAGPGECSERVSFEDLRQRIQKTLDFLRENDRPNWQAVVEEHQRFLATFDEG